MFSHFFSQILFKVEVHLRFDKQLNITQQATVLPCGYIVDLNIYFSKIFSLILYFTIIAKEKGLFVNFKCLSKQYHDFMEPCNSNSEFVLMI